MSAVAPGDDSVWEPLYKEELARYSRNKGVTAVTFYDGDAAEAAKAVKQRLRLVLDANPWIAGQIVGQQLVHPKAGSDALVSELFSEQAAPGVNETAPYEALNESCVNLGVQNCATLRKTGARVTKIVVVPISSDRFALIISMSHLIADGATYYAIQNMLAEGAEVRSLSATRKDAHDLKSKEQSLMLPGDYKWANSRTMIKAMIKGIMSKPKGRVFGYYVDEDKMAACKEKAGRDGWVSSNDVLTSHYGAATGARVMMFTFNYRNRHAIFEDTDAGNLEGTILLDPEGYATPSAIRKSLTSGDGKYHRHSASGSLLPLPGWCEKCPMAFMSSWASLGSKGGGKVENGGIALPGATLRQHLPIIPMDFAKTPMDVAIVFRPQPGRLAVFYVAKHSSRATLTGGDSPLGASVCPQIFPNTTD